MTRRKRLFQHLVAVLICLSGNAASAQSQDAVIDQQLKQMQEELRRLRDDNAQMRGELEDVRRQSGEAWLNEKRADEIRALVQDVLADADTRSSLQSNGMTAGWADGFFLSSEDGRFKLMVDGQVQVRWIHNYRDVEVDNNRAGWEMPRANFTFRGHVFNRDWTYLVRMEQTRNEKGLVEGLYFVQDAWIRLFLDEDWSIRFGQFKLPFNYEELVDSAYQQAVERSLLNENLNLGRSQGLELRWERDEMRWAIALSDGGADRAGGFNIVGTYPPYTPWSDELSDYTISTRFEYLFAGTWKQFEDFTSPMQEEFALMFGIGGHMQKDERTGSAVGNETEWYAYTVDVASEFGGANLFASWTHFHFDTPTIGPVNVMGFVVQGGMYVTPKTEIFARFEYGRWEFDNSQIPDLSIVTMGFNYYIDGHDLKFTTDIGIGLDRVANGWVPDDLTGWRTEQRRNSPQVVFRTQFQLLF